MEASCRNQTVYCLFYCHALFTGTVIDSSNVNAIVEKLSNSIFDYFKVNYGSVKELDQSQQEMKYNNLATLEIKKDFYLKDINASLREFKYISHFLRPKTQSTPSITPSNLNHDSLISKNLWSYVKKRSSLFLSCTLVHCIDYFRRILSGTFPNKQFVMPSSIPQFEAPTYSFHVPPPSNQKVIFIIRCIKYSASLSPLAQILTICCKRCPY